MQEKPAKRLRLPVDETELNEIPEIRRRAKSSETIESGSASSEFVAEESLQCQKLAKKRLAESGGLPDACGALGGEHLGGGGCFCQGAGCLRRG